MRVISSQVLRHLICNDLTLDVGFWMGFGWFRNFGSDFWWTCWTCLEILARFFVFFQGLLAKPLPMHEVWQACAFGVAKRSATSGRRVHQVLEVFDSPLPRVRCPIENGKQVKSFIVFPQGLREFWRCGLICPAARFGQSVLIPTMSMVQYGTVKNSLQPICILV